MSAGLARGLPGGIGNGSPGGQRRARAACSGAVACSVGPISAVRRSGLADRPNSASTDTASACGGLPSGARRRHPMRGTIRDPINRLGPIRNGRSLTYGQHCRTVPLHAVWRTWLRSAPFGTGLQIHRNLHGWSRSSRLGATSRNTHLPTIGEISELGPTTPLRQNGYAAGTPRDELIARTPMTGFSRHQRGPAGLSPWPWIEVRACLIVRQEGRTVRLGSSCSLSHSRS